jgi:hypothetical protein
MSAIKIEENSENKELQIYAELKLKLMTSKLKLIRKQEYSSLVLSNPIYKMIQNKVEEFP